MSTPVRFGAVALFALVGCAVSTAPSEEEAVESNSDTAAASWAPEIREITTVGAKLRNSFAPSARETVCVSYDGDLDVTALDEFECTTVRDPNGAGWVQMCASCIMELEEARNGTLYLAAHRDERCELFAGTYLLTPSATAQACGSTPPPDVTILPRCELGATDMAACLKEPSDYPRSYPEPYQPQLNH